MATNTPKLKTSSRIAILLFELQLRFHTDWPFSHPGVFVTRLSESTPKMTWLCGAAAATAE